MAAFIWLVATPMYLSEAHFVIRGAGAPMGAASGGGSSLSSLVSVGSSLSGMIDSYAVRDFLQSRDAMQRLEQTVGFASRVAKPDADLFVRTKANPGRDDLFNLYTSVVQARFNLMEQIVVLRVFAFQPSDAETMAQGLLKLAEEFADKLNKRAREDVQRVWEQEVQRSENRAVQARLAMSEWQRHNANIDPAANVTMLNALIAQQESSLAEARADLSQTIALGNGKDHPRRKAIEQRIEALQKQVDAARGRLTGIGSSQASQLVEFEKLKVEQEFAEKNLETTRAALEQARLAAISQEKYVSLVQAPSLPDTKAYPYPPWYLAGALLAGVLGLIIGSLLLGVARDALAR